MIIEDAKIKRMELLSQKERALVNNLHVLISQREEFHKSILGMLMDKGCITINSVQEEFYNMIEGDHILRGYKEIMEQIFKNSISSTMILNKENI